MTIDHVVDLLLALAVALIAAPSARTLRPYGLALVLALVVIVVIVLTAVGVRVHA